MTQQPLLLRSGLTGRIYVVTRYKVLDAEKGRIEAITKHDVTEQVDALVAEAIAERSKAERGRRDAGTGLGRPETSEATATRPGGSSASQRPEITEGGS
jgi:hypothetical protein